MNNYKIKIYSLTKDKFINDIPQSFTKYISKYAQNKSFTCEILFKNKTIFIARFYYLTKNYKKIRNYPENVKYELGDVYLYPEYQGIIDKNINKKISSICMELILKNNKDNIILWVTKDNIPAIKLYEKFNFSKIKNSKKMEEWIYKVFSKNNEWIIKHKIIFIILIQI